MAFTDVQVQSCSDFIDNTASTGPGTKVSVNEQNGLHVVDDNDYALSLSRRAVTEFFRRTGLPVPETGALTLPDTPVSARIRTTVASWDFGGIPAERVQRHVVTGTSMAATAYAHTHPDTQVHIALFTVLCLCVDDLEVDAGALAAFVPRMQAGETQAHPVLARLAQSLRAMPEFFHPYAATAILVGTVHFVNCTLVERQTDGMPLHPTALPYVLYKRARNSLGEVYAAFVWDKFNFPDISSHIQVTPETMIYLDYSNDILSFYKEELAGERNNFVHDWACVTEEDVQTVLSNILDELVHAVERARGILQGAKEKETWEQFLAGWVAFHFLSPRYKLAHLTSACP